jgi:hypothetical protein
MHKQISTMPEKLGTRSPDLGEMTIIMDPAYGWATYIGTREQLEAEYVIPPGSKWPDGFTRADWVANGIHFTIERRRPDGVKGPRRDFINCDNWHLRMSKVDDYYPDRQIMLQAKELRRMIYLESSEGRAAFMRMIDLSLAADKDENFQAFKALIPGLIPPPRKPRGRNLPVQTQEARHG